MGKLNNGEEGEKTVLMHFSHDHALELTKLLKTNPGNHFACATCDFSLHRDCAELPRKIYHPSDANHELILTVSPSFHCRACGTAGSGFSYHCDICLADMHSLCSTKPLSAIHEAHPHWLTLEFKPPYQGEEGFRCDICEQPGSDQWLYRCQQCEYDVHLHCSKSQAGQEVHNIIQEKPAFEASSRALSLPSSTQQPAINTTSVAPSVESRESSQVFKKLNVSGTTQQALANPNMAITTAQGYLTNTASRSLPMVSSQYRPDVARVYQSSKSSVRFQANGQALDRTINNRSGINQLIPKETITNRTRGPINNANPPVVATQYQPNVTYAQQGTNYPGGRHAYSSNGFVYLSSTQARDNLPIHLRPNGKAPMAIVLQRNQGSTYAALARNEANQGGMNGMVVGEVASGIGQAFGQEMFQEPTGGWDEGSMAPNLDGGTEMIGKALRKLILPW